jgi:hypothetical protein
MVSQFHEHINYKDDVFLTDLSSQHGTWITKYFMLLIISQSKYRSLESVYLICFASYCQQRRKEINDSFKLLMIPIELMLCFETQFQNLLCGLIGLPPSNVVLPQSPMHTKSLAVLKK